ncbi:MAG: cytochrome-c peroxidase [Acidimicrobiia bacterium]|nr:cytochrome-c peroxidase [Acidimicrobiia bacterium]
MSALSERPWLAWAPPVLVAVLVVAALQVGRSDPGVGDEVAGGSPAAGSGAETATAGGPALTVDPVDTTPTTGFAQREPTLPAEPFAYGTELPAHVDDGAVGGPPHQPLSALDTARAAPVTDDGATLGRVLFYDVNLSVNRTVRCASCHVQVHSFTDPLLFSQGVDGIRTRRNSMSLANARFNASGRFLWDEAAPSLGAQVLMPFVDPFEMGLTEQLLLDRIRERAFYRTLFANAFGDDTVTLERVSSALAQFIRAMVSLDSRYDEGRARVGSPLDEFPNFSPAENEGKELFFTPSIDGGAGCASCDVSEAQLTSPSGLDNNGLDPPTEVFVPPDLGAFEVTGDPADAGRFRVPSLRNVEVTAPYMHDGRLTTLEAVIDHYDAGVQPHENLSRELLDGDGRPLRLGLTGDQKAALVAFLKTLTDDGFLTDERFSEPFRAP